jgi:hypothetical protein
MLENETKRTIGSILRIKKLKKYFLGTKLKRRNFYMAKRKGRKKKKR